MAIKQDAFGVTPEGVTIERFILTNGNGLEASIITYGGTLTALRVPDRNGTLSDVVLGFDSLESYLGEHPYFGSLIGRYGNRIADGRFTLDGVSYTLARNNGANHLHGGPNGFHRAIWQAQTITSGDGPTLELRYLSRDGEEGYPGNLSVTVRYTLTEQNELRLDYQAQTDQATVINLTNHSYFNLAGNGDILGHQLELLADHFLPVDDNQIPLGQLQPVHGTPMDFTRATPIGARIGEDDEQLRAGQGYDHTWVLNGGTAQAGLAARLYDPSSGRVMEVETTEPGIQFYSGNLLDGSVTGKGGQIYQKHAALCLETQHFPDSPNQPRFPSTVLRPGDTYRQTTAYRFAVQA
jgi:aldose 1-epimerase